MSIILLMQPMSASAHVLPHQTGVYDSKVWIYSVDAKIVDYQFIFNKGIDPEKFASDYVIRYQIFEPGHLEYKVSDEKLVLDVNKHISPFTGKTHDGTERTVVNKHPTNPFPTHETYKHTSCFPPPVLIIGVQAYQTAFAEEEEVLDVIIDTLEDKFKDKVIDTTIRTSAGLTAKEIFDAVKDAVDPLEKIGDVVKYGTKIIIGSSSSFGNGFKIVELNPLEPQPVEVVTNGQHGEAKIKFLVQVKYADYRGGGKCKITLPDWEKPGQRGLVEETAQLPDWIKNNAEWWASGLISDADFVTGIEYMVQKGVIRSPNLLVVEGDDSIHATKVLGVPSWVKNSAKWWAAGEITDEDFTKGIEYMVESKIIRSPKIQILASEVEAMPPPPMSPPDEEPVSEDTSEPETPDESVLPDDAAKQPTIQDTPEETEPQTSDDSDQTAEPESANDAADSLEPQLTPEIDDTLEPESEADDAESDEANVDPDDDSYAPEEQDEYDESPVDEPENLHPVAEIDYITTHKDTAVTINPLDNDYDPDTYDELSITEVLQPMNGVIEQQGDSIVYTPDSGFVGQDEFDYYITDSNDHFAISTVRINVIEDEAEPSSNLMAHSAIIGPMMTESENNFIATYELLVGTWQEDEGLIAPLEEVMFQIEVRKGGPEIYDPDGLLYTILNTASNDEGFVEFSYTVPKCEEATYWPVITEMQKSGYQWVDDPDLIQHDTNAWIDAC